jgi:hypothetical protein
MEINKVRSTHFQVSSEAFLLQSRLTDIAPAYSGGPMRPKIPPNPTPSSSFHPYVWNQLAESRREQRGKWLANRSTDPQVKRHWTLSDLARKEREELDIKYNLPSTASLGATDRMGSINAGTFSSSQDLERLGREALELTNKYREKCKKVALKWNNVLYKVALQHSKGTYRLFIASLTHQVFARICIDEF